MKRIKITIAAALVMLGGLSVGALAGQPPVKFATVQLPGQSGPYYEYILTVSTVGNIVLPKPPPLITAYYSFDNIPVNYPAAQPFNKNFSTYYEKKNKKSIVITFYMQFGTAQHSNFLDLYSENAENFHTDLKAHVKQIEMPAPPNPAAPIYLNATQTGNYNFSVTEVASPGAGKLPSPPPPFTAAILSSLVRRGTDIPVQATASGSSLDLSFTLNVQKTGRYVIRLQSPDAWLTQTQESNTFSI